MNIQPQKITSNTLKVTPHKIKKSNSINNFLIPLSSSKQDLAQTLTPSSNTLRDSRTSGIRVSCNRNMVNSQVSSWKYQKLRNSFLQNLDEQILAIQNKIGQKQKQKIPKMRFKLDECSDPQDFTLQFTRLFAHCLKIDLQNDETHEYRINLNRLNRAKITLLTSEQDKSISKKKRLLQSQKQNSIIKRQLFKCKQLIKLQQKRILGLIEQFKHRKEVYMKQIQKLTGIVNTTIRAIPQYLLAAQKSKDITSKQQDITINRSPTKQTNSDHYNFISDIFDFKQELSNMSKIDGTARNGNAFNSLQRETTPSKLHKYRSVQNLFVKNI